VAEKPELNEEHFLVPGHFLVKEEDAPALLEKLNATKDNLPGILKMDPAIKKLKAKRGDIIRIERKSLTAGKTTYYRVVR
jgi:DNA-directed RNA polymerase subunit H